MTWLDRKWPIYGSAPGGDGHASCGADIRKSTGSAFHTPLGSTDLANAWSQVVDLEDGWSACHERLHSGGASHYAGLPDLAAGFASPVADSCVGPYLIGSTFPGPHKNRDEFSHLMLSCYLLCRAGKLTKS